MNELERTNELGIFLQTIGSNTNVPTVKNVELDEDELAAGGIPATGICLSKGVAEYRMVLPSGKNASYEIYDQSTNTLFKKLDSVDAIFLLAHHVYKLRKYHVENLNKKFEDLTDDDKQILAASFDVRAVYNKDGSRKYGSNGNFEAAKYGAYLKNPKLFNDVTNRFSRIHIYAMFPFLPEFNGKIIFITLTVTGATQYDNLLKNLSRRNLKSLPYNIVRISSTEATSKSKIDYRKPKLEFVPESESFNESHMDMLRQEIRPKFKALAALHEEMVQQSEIGIISDYDDEKEAVGVTSIVDDEGNEVF